ncbi:MAG: 16S rRNA (uracil(1498)-N(3))-methyltransferase [Candidatus Latescibacterota bacterium]|nr:MAG: 16S rRNA (uracil(1498)-N(3))-methyltransferase [Candidatus Latescibacterota bacterium]
MTKNLPHQFLLYSEELDHRSRLLEVSGDEHHHAARVLRLKPGDTVFVTNGRGIRARCGIEVVGKNSTRFNVLECSDVKETGPQTTLALACLRRPAFEQAVKQCTELGMDRCIPFVSEQSHMGGYGPEFHQRLRRVTLSAMKQSFRATLPVVESVKSFDTLVKGLTGSRAIVVGDVGGTRFASYSETGTVTIVVGPEGGLTTAEHEALSAVNAVFVSVSPHRLRSETAAAALTAMVRNAQRD